MSIGPRWGKILVRKLSTMRGEIMIKDLICKWFGHKIIDWHTVRVEDGMLKQNGIKKLCVRCLKSEGELK